MRRRRDSALDIEVMNRAVADLQLPDAVWKTCPWQPSDEVATGLRQWLRCAGAALRDRKVIGMPSHAVDEAWHGLILCTATYAEFCDAAYGQFLHHHPDSGAPSGVLASAGSSAEQLSRTVVAWSMVSAPGERCVLWDLDARIGVEPAWGVPADQVDAILAEVRRLG
jgi:hypothetical protein